MLLSGFASAVDLFAWLLDQATNNDIGRDG
jgi:hypothetical protein